MAETSRGEELYRTALRAAREARIELAAAARAIDESPTSDDPAMRALASEVTLAVRRLYAAETRDARGVLEDLGEAREKLVACLDVPAPVEVKQAIGAALTIVHPARDELERALDDEEQPEMVIPLSVKRVHRSEPDRRRAERVPIESVVGFHTDTNFFTGFGGDLSDGGLFVATWNVLSVGTPIALSFVLPSGRQVNVRGVVSWVREPPVDEEVAGYRPGMGVAFESISDVDRTLVLEFLRARAPIFHG
jgi:uncharacterized protein (TIGR02266 family)